MNIERDYVFEKAYSEPVSKTYPEALREILLPIPSVKLPLMPSLTKITGGLRPREFSILCGATGVGKTTFVANLSVSLLMEKTPHFVASVETGKNDYVRRVISAFEGEDWNTGDPIDVNKTKAFHLKHGEFMQSDNLHLSLYENRFTVEKLMNDIAYMSKEHNCKIAIIDNLNFFMEVRRQQDQVVEMDRVIHELIIFCKQIDVHVIMIMHPKKTDNGRVENEFDIKGSSTAVQEAHNVFLFNRPGDDLIKQGFASKTDRELKIAKMRRKGKAVGSRIVLKSVNGVRYMEGIVV